MHRQRMRVCAAVARLLYSCSVQSREPDTLTLVKVQQRKLLVTAHTLCHTVQDGASAIVLMHGTGSFQHMVYTVRLQVLMRISVHHRNIYCSVW
jgi:hypothetical protein